MPNGGPDNCGTCKFNATNTGEQKCQNRCMLRDVNISNPFWTYCANWRDSRRKNMNPYGRDFGTKPYGPMFSAGIYEGYIRIPWNGKYEPKIYKSGKCSICGKEFKGDGISIIDNGKRREFCSNSHYMKWWRHEYPDTPLIFKHVDGIQDGAIPVNLHSLYNEVLKEGYFSVDFMNNGRERCLPPINKNREIILDKIKGAFLGGAIGGALGSGVKGFGPGKHWVEKYQGSKGLLTDDAQMALWTAESLLENKGLNPDKLARRFINEHIRGLDSAMKEFVMNSKFKRKAWYKAGIDSDGNGAVVRSVPVGIYYADNFEDMKLAAGMQSVITHNNPMAIAAGIAMAVAVSWLLRMDTEEFEGKMKRAQFCRDIAGVIENMESGREYRTRNTKEFDTLYNRIYKTIPELLMAGRTPREVNSMLWSGQYTLESVPFALYCFLYSPEDFRQTLLNAANYSVDSDTAASIACSLSGALNGASAIDEYYIKDLEFKDGLMALAEKFYR